MSAAAEDLASRIRSAIGPRADIEEKKMFGGIGFMLGGNMMVGVSAKGALMIRADPDGINDILALPGAAQLHMGERVMKGFVTVADDAIADPAALAAWIGRAEAYARTLPAK